MDRGLNPELRALMATVREDEEELRKALEEGVEWESLIPLAVREGATRILHSAVCALLEAGAEFEVDPAALSALKTRALRQEMKIVALDGLLARLLLLFREERIPVLLLKGQAFQKAIVGSPFERPANDLDILVGETDAERAWKLAQRHGWDWDSEAWPLDRYREHHHLPPLMHGLGLRLEIHTDLFPAPKPFLLSVDQVLEQARPLPGQEWTLTPCPEHLLLHAAVHFAWSHQMEFGIWRTLRDLNALVSRDVVTWDKFLVEAKASRGVPAAFWTLHLGQRWAGIPIPPLVLQALAPSSPSAFRVALERHFSACIASPSGFRPHAKGRSVWLDRKLWELAMRPDEAGARGIRPWAAGAMEGGRGEERARPTGWGLAGASSFLRTACEDVLHLTRVVTGM